MPLQFQLKLIMRILIIFVVLWSGCKRNIEQKNQENVSLENSLEKGWTAKIVYDTFFKTMPEESLLLADSEKCKVPKGTTVPLLAKPLESSQQHFFLAFDPDIFHKKCGFSQGYFFIGHVEIIDPKGALYYSSGYGRYIYPIENGYNTSFWCSCRSLPGATSPHVGQDIGVINTNRKSLAIADAVVKNVYLSSWSCGYTVEIEDQFSTLWRYVHLNRPRHLKVGQQLKKGNFIGLHKSYPKAGCGNGAHLHLERRSPGKIWGNDISKMKDCGRGFRACYFNPNRPFEKRPPSTNPAAQSVSAGAIYGGANNPYRTAAVQDILNKPDPELVFPKSSWPPRDTAGRLVYPNPYNDDAADIVDEVADAALIPVNDVGSSTLGFKCQKTQSSYPEGAIASSESFPRTGNFNVKGMLVPITGPQAETVQKVVHVSAFLQGNSKNICKDGQDCIVSWELLVSSNGKWQSVATQPGSRNGPVGVHADQGFCVSNAPHEFIITGKTAANHMVTWKGIFEEQSLGQ